MFRFERLVFCAALVSVAVFAAPATAGSIGTYSGCKSLKGGARSACEQCVGGGNFFQPSSNSCGMAEGMRPSKALPTEKPPPRPTAMPKTGLDYVTIEPGTFDIGSRSIDSDKTDKDTFEVKVTLTHRFAMKTTEVTQGEWLYIVGAPTPSYDKRCGLDCPAGSVSWIETINYLNMLSKRDKLEPCYVVKGGLATWAKGYECLGYRLPTDAEWEYAARGGNEEQRYGELDAIAWYSGNSGGMPHPVGKKQKNAFGLFDMLGNVFEWVWDAEEYKPYPADVTDPMIGGLALKSEGQDRVMRGGSYKEMAYEVRAPFRFQYLANSGSDNHGFRPVRTLPAK